MFIKVECMCCTYTCISIRGLYLILKNVTAVVFACILVVMHSEPEVKESKKGLSAPTP